MMLPLHAKQTRLIKGCGPASLALILQYYGANVTEEELLFEHEGIEKSAIKGIEGTYEIENATIAAKRGYKVTAYTANTQSLGLNTDFANQYVSKELLETRLKNPQVPQREILERSLRAVSGGVNLLLIQPTARLLQTFLQQEKPLHISANANSLYDTKKFNQQVGHSIVLMGYDANNFHYADPELGHISQIKQERLIESIRAHAQFHSVYLIAITK